MFTTATQSIIAAFLLALLVTPMFELHAQQYIDARKLLPKSSVYFSPRMGSFVEGSTFDVPILLDTKGSSVNGIEVRINFDQNKLSIVQPSGGQSIIGVWVEPPAYDNTRGTASYVGVVPNGIVTDSGLVGTVTFKAKTTGKAVVSVRADSNILLNDGLGTDTAVDLGRAEYTILPKAPEGVIVFSDTHPSQSEWYNNKNPVLSWQGEEGVTGYSYVLDTKPLTVPENTIATSDTVKAYENLDDGLWYFHVKANKKGAWSNAGHFLVRIDTTPPALFEPRVEYVLAAVAFVERALVSFFTTDSLSGIDHYEVGVIDKSQPVTESPSFVQAESPFQIPTSSEAGVRVMIRAVDNAGNVRDVSVDVKAPTSILRYIEEYIVPILLGIILLALLILLFHYIFGHHIIRNLRRAFKIVHEEEDLARGVTMEASQKHTQNSSLRSPMARAPSSSQELPLPVSSPAPLPSVAPVQTFAPSISPSLPRLQKPLSPPTTSPHLGALKNFTSPNPAATQSQPIPQSLSPLSQKPLPNYALRVMPSPPTGSEPSSESNHDVRPSQA